MRKVTFLFLTFFTLWGCQNEEDPPQDISLAGASTEFVLLCDGNARTAGTLKIEADLPNVELTWITSPVCNLDTEQTSVVLNKGKGELPIRWARKLDDGNYAPNGTAFKAWVKLTGTNYSKIVPLVWAEKMNMETLENIVLTRADGTPRVTTFAFDPPTVVMNENGGTVDVLMENVGPVSFTYSGLEENNIDTSSLPTTVTENTTLNFQWINNQPATNAFTIAVVGMSKTGFWNSFTISYTPGASGDDKTDLVFDHSNLPIGNIPQAGAPYDFYFTATNYTGSVQVNAFDSQGNVIDSGTQSTNKVSTVAIPANDTGNPRNIIFKYKVDGNNNWLSLPDSILRVQDAQGSVPPQPGDTVAYTSITPFGVIPDSGGDYSTVFNNWVGIVEFRAVSGQGREFDTKSVTLTAGGVAQVSLKIPEASSFKDNTVLFQCREEGGEWKTMETRTQIVETFASGSIIDMPEIIPVDGGTYHYVSEGTLSAQLTIVVKENNKVLVESKGAAGGTINITVPANTTGKLRSLFFWYTRADRPGKYYYIQRGDQSGSK